jgi:predicted RNase H-like nuclease
VRVLGVDLAWGEGDASRAANETGVAAVEPSGQVLDAGWTIGLDETIAWVERMADADTLLMVDAPLMVTNATGQRPCERNVGQRYGRWKVAANSTNLRSPRLAGVRLRERLEVSGWRYDDGCSGPPTNGWVLSEVYPYATIVGAAELGYTVERPIYKRKPKTTPVTEFRPRRAAVCDDLIARLLRLGANDPPLDLASNATTARLADEPSPLDDRTYKHREDLIDALVCAWTGLLWQSHGLARCQVLGSAEDGHPHATIIAPARPEQRSV